MFVMILFGVFFDFLVILFDFFDFLVILFDFFFDFLAICFDLFDFFAEAKKSNSRITANVVSLILDLQHML